MDDRGPPLVTVRLVEVRIASEGGQDRARHPDGKGEVARHRGEAPRRDEQPVGQDAHRPRPDRDIGQHGVEGMAEKARPVHHVLDRLTRSTEGLV